MMCPTKESQTFLAGTDVLIVDDSLMIRTLLNDLLAHLGMNIHLAADGNEALELFKKKHFDLILMDLNMPKLNGIATTVQLRSKGCSCPIIGITSASDCEIEKASQLGFNAFIEKPVDATILVNKITNILNIK
ncbi:response regulator [Pleionea sediminis]|uniref:response regulator n=1 Tax=Pleionea sediminis TaxID=2569479 RepID=UPI0011872111|nr:response regulator [Pleionea sediminis]